MFTVIVDTGFWVAIIDKNDKYHQESVCIIEKLNSNFELIIPWPTLYEFLKGKDIYRKFFDIILEIRNKGIKLNYYHDENLRERCIRNYETFRSDLSLVDLVILEIGKEISKKRPAGDTYFLSYDRLLRNFLYENSLIDLYNRIKCKD